MHLIFKALQNNKVLYKADSFWSLIEKREDAKIHSSSNNDHLFSNLIYLVNKSLELSNSEDEKRKCISYYHNMLIGFDRVERKGESYEFNFLGVGEWIYKIRYVEDQNKFELIDISRKLKLEKLNKISE